DRDVTVDLFFGVATRKRGVRHQKSDSGFARPTRPMHPDVHDEPARAPRVETERAELLIRIAEQPEFRAQAFRVERPAFDESGFVTEAAKPRQRGVARGILRLQVV